MDEEEVIAEKEETLEVEVEQPQIVEENTDNQEPETEAEEDLEEDVVITIGDDEPEEPKHEPAPQWVKDVRAENRRLKKELKEKSKIQNTEVVPVKVGEMPTIEDCDYDTEVHKKRTAEWVVAKSKEDQRLREEQKAKEAQATEWQEKLSTYAESKTKLKVKNFEDVEEVVTEKLSEIQQGLILQGSDNSAKLVYALGTNKKYLDDLAKIKDPVKFTFAVAKLEAQMKVSNRKAPPKPEKVLSSNGGTSGVVDSTLERLREKASKSGDYSEVRAYKMNLRKG